MVPQWLIEKKRDGKSLTEEEIRFLIEGYTSGDVPDYQMAAFAMAVYFQGMSSDEVAVLTDAMMRSGRLVDTSSVPWPTSDKHSTGGIGDKVSLVLAPLVACCEVAVPMISGRGLGITGGTLDKLEALPGYRTDLSVDEFLGVLGDCGCSIIGQTSELAPADRKLYALRDVTGTVPSIPLISASIMSKKLAEGAESLVLDVKCGRGAFMTDLDGARALARTMVEIGVRMGRGMTAVITDMNQPLGRTVGNAVEVAEAIDTLRGRGPADLVDVTLELASHMLLLSGKVDTRETAMEMLRGHLASGVALDRFRHMVRLHGGDDAAIEDTTRLPSARLHAQVPAPDSGSVAEVDAELIGKACLVLGAGRTKTSDVVDPAVGITGLVKVGETVERGQPLLGLQANDDGRLSEARTMLEQAVSLSKEPVPPPSLVLETIQPEGEVS